MDFYSQNREDRVCFFHDAFPIAHLRHPELFELTEGHVRVGTGPLDRGQTVVAPLGTTPSPLWTEANTIKVATKVKICISIDTDICISLNLNVHCSFHM